MNIIKSYSTGNQTRSKNKFDSSNVSMFAENMKQIDPKIEETIKSPLVLFNLLAMEQVDAGVNMYEYQMYDSTGVGSYTANRASDIPLVNRIGSMYLSPMGTVDIAMEVSQADIEISEMLGVNHVTKLRDQCVRGLYERMEETLLRGFTPAGLKGLFNFDAGNTEVAHNWYTSTAEEILSDITSAYDIAYDQTGGNIAPDTMLVSSGLYQILFSKPSVIANTYTGTNLMDIIESSLNLKVIRVPKLSKDFSANTRDGFFLKANNHNYLIIK